MSTKKSFYCWYLGFTEAYGQQGQNKVYDLVKNLVDYENHESNAIPPSKITLHLSEKAMILIDSTEIIASNNKKQRKANIVDKGGATQKTYTIGYDQITFVGRLADPQFSDVLTCIVRNESEQTPCVTTFYLHAFRCDSDETAKKMEQYLNYFRRLYFKKIEKHQMRIKENFIKQNSKNVPSNKHDNQFQYSKNPNQQQQSKNSNLKENFIKRQMFKITDHFNHSHSSGGTRSLSNETYYSPEISPSSPKVGMTSRSLEYEDEDESNSRPQSPKVYENIHMEIAGKLEAGEPFLFPPKDYSELNRKRGNLTEAENRRCLNEKIVGEMAVKLKSKKDAKSGKLDSPRKSVDSLSFNEQANQVLNYFDEIVDSVDSVYKPPIPIDSNRNLYKYEPPEEEEFYEPYEPIENNNNNKSIIKQQTLPVENEYIFQGKRNQVMNKKSKSQAPTSRNISQQDVDPVHAGIHPNVLPVLGNYTPKMYTNGVASVTSVQTGSKQRETIYRPLNDSNIYNSANIDNTKQQGRIHKSIYDESVYKNPDYDTLPQNNYNNNNNMNLGRTHKDTSHVYVSENKNYNNNNSQFILKPYTNYIQVQDLKNYNSPISANRNAGTVINIYDNSNQRQSRRPVNASPRGYEINDIYY